MKLNIKEYFFMYYIHFKFLIYFLFIRYLFAI